MTGIWNKFYKKIILWNIYNFGNLKTAAGAAGERIPDNPFFITLFQSPVMAGLVRHRAKQFETNTSQLFRKHLLACSWVYYVFFARFVIYIYIIQIFR